MTFEAFNLDEALCKALQKENLIEPTPIQQQAIPLLLENRDLIGFARTGTGKTVAFLLPVIQKLQGRVVKATPEVLILAPTRELARQIGETLAALMAYTSLTYAVVYGGVPVEEQIEILSAPVNVLVATPGRLLDLLNRNAVTLEGVSMFVLDEADQMLTLGFFEDIQTILGKLPAGHQSLLFSATHSQQIDQLAEEVLHNPVRIAVEEASTASEYIEQKVYYVEKHNKPLLLIDFLRKPEVKSAIVFTKTRKSTDSLHERLQEAGFKTDRLHSDRSQHARDSILEAFRSGELPILVATDIAARGIDVAHLTHVFNFELPQEAETYIHRVGRTGRAGKEGMAITLCDPDDKAMLGDIQKLMRKCIPVVENHTYATLALKQALEVADLKIAGKAVAKKSYKGNKANGDYFRRQKLARKKQGK